MYERLTSLLEEIKKDSIGEWSADKENDGSPEHPIRFPFVTYSEFVNRFEHEVYAFEEANPGYGLNRYGEILDNNGIEWGSNSMKRVDVSKLSGRTAMPPPTAAVRPERPSAGPLRMEI